MITRRGILGILAAGLAPAIVAQPMKILVPKLAVPRWRMPGPNPDYFEPFIGKPLFIGEIGQIERMRIVESRSIPKQTAADQRLLNATMRQMLDNAHLASNPRKVLTRGGGWVSVVHANPLL